ncbi:NUDIX hydrolase [Sinomicrobium kalidii]|uniref:NUDIX hydrolase n=1 Tax=Sinomicrobium kalidii TaxID=2900738 RepID=UPI00349EB849
MASIPVKELREIDVAGRNPRKAGVMALFYPDRDDITKIVLLLRKEYKGVHSNQVGFPGGKREKEDKDIRATALRETMEEVGVASGKIEVIRAMTTLYIPPSNFLVHPFLGVMKEPPVFFPQEEEVEEVIEVPLGDVLDDSLVSRKTITTSYAVNVNVPVFNLKGYVVWGATAAMLSEVRDLVGSALR